MNDLVSIIIPVYNSSAYLEETINSIVQQSYKNLEVIIVDDFSTDNGKEIIKKFAAKDKRIISIFLDKNNGVSNARNVGLDAAKGKYVLFMDSDDNYSNLNAIENIINKLDADTESVVFPIRKVVDKSEVIADYSLPEQSLHLDKFKSFRFAFEKNVCESACNKLFLLDIIKKNKIQFSTNIKLNEDQLFNAKYFFYINNINIINDVYYNYNIHGDSACRVKRDESFFKENLFYLFEEYLEFLKDQFDNDASVYELMNVMLFTKCFSPIRKRYKKLILSFNDRIPAKYKKICSEHLNKKIMIKNDYYFAKSYFSSFYRWTAFLIISLGYYIKTLFHKMFK